MGAAVVWLVIVVVVVVVVVAVIVAVRGASSWGFGFKRVRFLYSRSSFSCVGPVFWICFPSVTRIAS
jgi:hypothetical protein